VSLSLANLSGVSGSNSQTIIENLCAARHLSFVFFQTSRIFQIGNVVHAGNQRRVSASYEQPRRDITLLMDPLWRIFRSSSPIESLTTKSSVIIPRTAFSSSFASKKTGKCSALSRAEKAERLQRTRDPADQLVLVTPYRRVYHTVLPILHARLLQRADAISAVVLQLRVFRLDGVTGASGTQARQRKVIVQGDYSFRIVEALDVLVRLCKVLRAIHVLQHVHVPARRIRLEVATSERSDSSFVGKTMLVANNVKSDSAQWTLGNLVADEASLAAHSPIRDFRKEEFSLEAFVSSRVSKRPWRIAITIYISEKSSWDVSISIVYF